MARTYSCFAYNIRGIRYKWRWIRAGYSWLGRTSVKCIRCFTSCFWKFRIFWYWTRNSLEILFYAFRYFWNFKRYFCIGWWIVSSYFREYFFRNIEYCFTQNNIGFKKCCCRGNGITCFRINGCFKIWLGWI